MIGTTAPKRPGIAEAGDPSAANAPQDDSKGGSPQNQINRGAPQDQESDPVENEGGGLVTDPNSLG